MRELVLLPIQEVASEDGRRFPMLDGERCVELER